MANVKEKKTNRLALVLSIVALIALLLGLGIQIGLGFWRYRQSRAAAGQLFADMRQTALAQAQGERGRRILIAEDAQETAAPRLRALAAQKGETQREKQLELLIKDYAETNRMDLDGKTKSLTFGSLGFRKSTSIIVKKAKAVLIALRAMGMDDCINVKESVNKEALRGYSDDVITKVGCVKKVDDVFWYEPDFEKLEQ